MRKSYLISVLLLTNATSFALNPVPGWYAGVFLGVTYEPSSSFSFQPPISYSRPGTTFSAESGSLSYSVLGGIGGQIGYRFCDRYRIEGEVMYNNNPFSTLKINNVTVNSIYLAPTVPPNSITFNNIENSANAHIQGDTNTGAFMINAIYDLLTTGSDNYSNVVPFVGIGVGYSYVQNSLQFYRAANGAAATNTTINREIFDVLQTRKTYAGQLMGGVNYFLDDFTWFSISLRYFTTGSSTPSSTYTFITPTESVTTHSSAISLFGTNTQLISAYLSFNGAFDFG